MNVSDAVKAKAKQKRQMVESKLAPDPADIKILDIIEDLLRDRCCFLKIDIETSLKILIYLGYSRDEAGDMYAKLVRKAWIGEYTIVEPPGIIVKSDDWYREV